MLGADISAALCRSHVFRQLLAGGRSQIWAFLTDRNKAAAAPGADIGAALGNSNVHRQLLEVGDGAGRGSCKEGSFHCDVTAVLGRTILTGGGILLRVV